MKLAEQFLTANLPDDDPDLSGDLAQSIITDAITKYGERVVKTVLKSIETTPKPIETGW